MDKIDLLNRFGKAYKNEGLPPVAGKIMGLFYISDKKYFDFDEIVAEVDASKGAVSKNLKLLIKLRRITHVACKESVRKRLFFLDINGVKYYIRFVIENYKAQDQLLKESLELRSKENNELNDFIKNSLEYNKEVLTFLELKRKQYFK